MDSFYGIVNKIFDQKNNILKIEKQINLIADLVCEKINNKGRIIFVGAGLLPEIAQSIINELWFNFQIEDGKFISLAAAKKYASSLEVWKSLEEIHSISIFELDEININDNDLVIALSASGKTEYVVSALKHAKSIGCKTALVTEAINSLAIEYADIIVDTNIGSPFIYGLNAAEGGTIQKLILDLIIYTAMEKSGRIYKNKLIFLKPVSIKLENYCINIISDLLKVDKIKAEQIFKENDSRLEVALLSNLKKISKKEAEQLLIKNKNNFTFCL